MGINALLTLLNVAIPQGISVYTIIHDRAKGTATVLVYLDQADAATADTQKQILDWYAAHPGVKPPTV